MPAPLVKTSAAAPERSLDQRMDALKRANDIRTARAKLKKDLKANRASINTILLDPPEYVMTAKVFDMLLDPSGLPEATRKAMAARLQGK